MQLTQEYSTTEGNIKWKLLASGRQIQASIW